MSASIAIASSTAAISANSSARARGTECKDIIASFDAKTSTIQEKQAYAECIKTIYPKEMTLEMAILLKIAIIFVFIMAVIPAYREYKRGGNITDIMFEGLMSTFMAVVILLVMGLAISGIIFIIKG